MAITFQSTELDSMRQRAAELGISGCLKIDINKAVAAIETWLETGFAAQPSTSLSAAIDAGTTPKVFTVVEKKMLLRVWLFGLWQKGGI